MVVVLLLLWKVKGLLLLLLLLAIMEGEEEGVDEARGGAFLLFLPMRRICCRWLGRMLGRW